MISNLDFSSVPHWWRFKVTFERMQAIHHLGDLQNNLAARSNARSRFTKQIVIILFSVIT